jgi:hypothetical protein
VDDNLTVIVLANLVNADSARIAHDLVGLYNAELAPVERKTEKIK